MNRVTSIMILALCPFLLHAMDEQITQQATSVIRLIQRAIDANTLTVKTLITIETAIINCDTAAYGPILQCVMNQEHVMNQEKKIITVFILTTLCRSSQLLTDLQQLCATPNLKFNEYAGYKLLTLLEGKRRREIDIVSCIQCLAENGLNIDSANKNGTTALIKYTLRNKIKIVDCLISLGANANLAAHNSLLTPLHHAYTPEMAQLLITKGNANIHARDMDGDSPLHQATAFCEDTTMLTILLKYGANINAQNNAGNTPLHIAGMFNKAHNEQALIAAGADCFLKNKKGILAVSVRLFSLPTLRKIQELT